MAGRLTLLQAPPTARGVVFVMLEDETGLGNLVFAPAVYRRCREALRTAPLVLATGRVQRRDTAVSVQVTGVEGWWQKRCW